MISNFNIKNRKDDIKVLCLIVIGFLFLVWLCTPTGNKLAEVCLYGNYTQWALAKLKNNHQATEYIFHRNNAIYLAKMNNAKLALKEMDLALKTSPVFLDESEISSLYKDRGEIRLYFKEYKGALNDFIRSGQNYSVNDRFRMALLLNMHNKKKHAIAYCNSVIEDAPGKYVGYACLANVYATSNRYDTAVKIFDMLIEKYPSNGLYLYNRAMYKLKAGDVVGYKQDLDAALAIAPYVEKQKSLIEETLNPTYITLKPTNIK